MKPFFWKLVICVLPCVLAAWVTVHATVGYYKGDPGGFKLGVDLVGGTILVYEIDLRKNQDAEKTFDPLRDINVLAESLKRRIDPNDLYNITIRPAGGEGRIEIILPTGGTHRTKKAEDNWNKLLADLEDEYLGFPYKYSHETNAADPGDNTLRFDNEALDSATKLYISKTDAKKNTLASDILTGDESTHRLKIRKRSDPTTYVIYDVIDRSTDNGTWVTIHLRCLSGEVSVKDGDELSVLPLNRELAVGRGKILELADKIQSIQSESLWKEKLFSSPAGWDRLKKNALLYWAKIDNDIKGDPDKNPPVKGNKALEDEFNALNKPGDLKRFSAFVENALAKTEAATTKKTIQNWIKKQAWDETMTQVRLKWKYLEPFQEDMERITPDSTEQLTTFVLSKGSVIGQAALSLLGPLVGDNLDRVFDGDDDPKANEVRAFIKDHYGPPVQEIMQKINAHMEKTGLGKDLSVEQVQRIKDLVSKVGSLEFSILANSTDDGNISDVGKPIGDAARVINDAALNAANAKEIEDAQQRGLPPPPPREARGGEVKAKRYIIVNARGTSKSAVTYRWVELGPQERRALNLDNAARTDSTRNTAWHAAKNNRNKAITLPEMAGAAQGPGLLQGALFYSRECKDRNLPEEERRNKEVEYFVLTRDPEFESETSEIRTPKIDGSYLVSAYGGPGADLRPTVHFTFNTAGGELFGNITRKNVSEDSSGPAGTQKRRHLAIILDGMVMSAPTINSEIRTQGQISGNFTQKEVDSLVNILRAGRLPATLKPQPVSENTIAATLGDDTISKGVRAILLSFGAVLIFMCIYYRFAGVVASVALMANLLLTVGFMVAVEATFTLSGLAGIVLTLGMAVDANVLIYERLREERERGASLLQAIRNGYDRALPTIIDTHLSSIFTAIVLYVVGNDNLKGFAVSMTVGLVISLFTSLYVTRAMFDYWQAKGWLTKLTMMRLFAKPDWDFMSIRYIMFGITLGLAILGAALFIGRLPNDLNIDFRGGTAYGGQLTDAVPVEQLRKLVDEKEQEKYLAGVIVSEVEGSEGRRYDLTFPKGDNKPRTVSLSNVPEGKTKEEWESNVAKRASLLPEPSVELLFNSSNDAELIKEMDEGKSRNFVMRTTEKEAELVQACADQLFRKKKLDSDDYEPLLKKVYARRDAFEKGETRLSFYATPEEAEAKEKKEPTATASPSFVKSLLNRELRRTLGIKDDKTALPSSFLFEVIPEGSSDKDGKYKVMKITFGPELKDENYKDVEKALNETVNAIAARPLPDRLENFDSALANETRLRAMMAILASWVAIWGYLWFRFGSWTFGLAAVICLIHDLFFTIGAIAACYFVHGTYLGDLLMINDFRIDLPSVAALLTLVGYSVNDTIVVFDRIREVRGKNPDLTPKMLNDSVNQTLSRTILSSLTVWLVVVVLYWFGGPGVHLFAFVMVVGVIVGTYSSIYIASPLLLMFGEGKHEETTPQGATLPARQSATA
jgi:SecD/SecF fusion protein